MAALGVWTKKAFKGEIVPPKSEPMTQARERSTVAMLLAVSAILFCVLLLVSQTRAVHRLEQGLADRLTALEAARVEMLAAGESSNRAVARVEGFEERVARLESMGQTLARQALVGELGEVEAGLNAAAGLVSGQERERLAEAVTLLDQVRQSLRTPQGAPEGALGGSPEGSPEGAPIDQPVDQPIGQPQGSAGEPGQSVGAGQPAVE